ncbi:hypothetical protein ABZT26_25825 [Streptomyces sp. NPDC005395]|uniref:hypothetical protein n=1 Tax=Streptomyces sp. NPDC005395 TaxID=3157042 RepID=UPI0033B1D151
MPNDTITPASQTDAKRVVTGRVMSGYDGPTSLSELVQLAAILARSRGGMVPAVYFHNPDAIVAVSFAARALDIPLWVALQELYTVKGVVGKKAILIRALWLRYGVEYDFEVTETECTGWIKRPGEDRAHEETYTILDAERLGLIERNPEWDKQPKAMLVARWTTTTANRWTPNIVLGMDTEDLSMDPADPDAGGWSTGEEIGPEVLRVLEEAGLAVKRGEGVDGLRRIWEQNLVLLDAWAGEGQTVRQVLTEMLAEQATKGLPTDGGTDNDGGGERKAIEPSGQPRTVEGTVVATGQSADQEQDDGDGGLWGPEEAAAARLISQAQGPEQAEADKVPLVAMDGALGCGCDMAQVIGGKGHTCLQGASQ